MTADLSALIARLEAGHATGIIMESEAVALQSALGLEDAHDTDWKQCCWNALRGSVDAAFGIAEQALPDREMALSQRKPRHLETCAEWWHATLFKVRTGVVFGVGPSTVTAKASDPALALVIAILRAKQGEGG
ncbi:hypothetical protein [Brevundimonas diminuta]|uniref:hypothetical protein n=1 Tax=Brevundimonas diminuta TaxID=293 RepID=UPI00320B738A